MINRRIAFIMEIHITYNTDEMEEIRESIRKAFHNLQSFFVAASRKAILITSVPFYWLFIFRMINWFDPVLFAFVVGFSYIFSFMNLGWGILN